MPETWKYNDVVGVLKEAPVPDAVRDSAFRAFYEAKDHSDLKSRLDSTGLPKQSKIALWNLRFPQPDAIQQEISSPDFQALPSQEKTARLGMMMPDFMKLKPEQQTQRLSEMLSPAPEPIAKSPLRPKPPLPEGLNPAEPGAHVTRSKYSSELVPAIAPDLRETSTPEKAELALQEAEGLLPPHLRAVAGVTVEPVIQGVRRMAHGASQLTTDLPPSPVTPNWARRVGGAGDIALGAMEAATPFVGAGAVGKILSSANKAREAATIAAELGGAHVGGEAARYAAEAAGAPPGVQTAAEAVGSAIPYGAAVRRIGAKPEAGMAPEQMRPAKGPPPPPEAPAPEQPVSAEPPAPRATATPAPPVEAGAAIDPSEPPAAWKPSGRSPETDAIEIKIHDLMNSLGEMDPTDKARRERVISEVIDLASKREDIIRDQGVKPIPASELVGQAEPPKAEAAPVAPEPKKLEEMRVAGEAYVSPEVETPTPPARESTPLEEIVGKAEPAPVVPEPEKPQAPKLEEMGVAGEAPPAASQGRFEPGTRVEYDAPNGDKVTGVVRVSTDDGKVHIQPDAEWKTGARKHGVAAVDPEKVRPIESTQPKMPLESPSVGVDDQQAAAPVLENPATPPAVQITPEAPKPAAPGSVKPQPVSAQPKPEPPRNFIAALKELSKGPKNEANFVNASSQLATDAKARMAQRIAALKAEGVAGAVKRLATDTEGSADPEFLNDLALIGADLVQRGAAKLSHFMEEFKAAIGPEDLLHVAKSFGTSVEDLVAQVHDKSLDVYREMRQAYFGSGQVAEKPIESVKSPQEKPNGTPEPGNSPRGQEQKLQNAAPAAPIEEQPKGPPPTAEGVVPGGDRRERAEAPPQLSGRSGGRPDAEHPGGVSPGESGTPPRGRREVITVREDLIPKVTPELAAKVPERPAKDLTPWQRDGVALAINAMEDPERGAFLVADGTGSGKTLTALATAKYWSEKGSPVVIVSKPEVFKFGQGTKSTSQVPVGSYGKWAKDWDIATERYLGQGKLEPGKVYYAQYSDFGKVPIDENTVVLYDEAHATKNIGASAQASTGKAIADKARAVLFLTATPADRPQNIAYLRRIGILEGKSRYQAVKDLGMTMSTVITRQGPVEKWEIDPAVGPEGVIDRLDSLFERMMAKGSMIKREIPMDNYEVNMHKVGLPEKWNEIEQIIADNLMPEDGASFTEIAHYLMNLRRQQEVFKVDEAVKLAQKEIAEGRKVVLFADRINRSVVNRPQMIRDEETGRMKRIMVPVTLKDGSELASDGTVPLLKKSLEAAGVDMSKVVELHGLAMDETGKKMKAPVAMEKFNQGPADLILATVQSGGTGLELDDKIGDAPRTIIFMTPPFGATESLQSLGRIFRLDTKSDARAHVMIADTGVDNWSAGIIQNKLKTLGALVKGAVQDIDVPKYGEVELPPELREKMTKKAGPSGSAAKKDKTKTGFPQFGGDKVSIETPEGKRLYDAFQAELPDPSPYVKKDKTVPGYLKWALEKATYSKTDKQYEVDVAFRDSGAFADAMDVIDKNVDRGNVVKKEDKSHPGLRGYGDTFTWDRDYGKMAVKIYRGDGGRMRLNLTLDRKDILPPKDWKPTGTPGREPKTATPPAPRRFGRY